MHMWIIKSKHHSGSGSSINPDGFYQHVEKYVDKMLSKIQHMKCDLQSKCIQILGIGPPIFGSAVCGLESDEIFRKHINKF